MSSSQDDSSLLGALRRLYVSIMEKHMNARANAFRDFDGAAEIPEIMSALSECIDKLATNPTMTVQAAATVRIEAASHNTQGNDTLHSGASFPVPNSGVGMGELSVYFRNTHKHSAFPSDTGEKLIQATWEHIYSAVRAAHQVDVKTARLHVDLANSAFKEAAHYLPAPAYAHFSQDVMSALQEINRQQGA